MGRHIGRRNARRVLGRTIPFVSYNSGDRVVLGHAVIAENSFTENEIELSPDGDEEIRAVERKDNDHA
jgi:hypothetical protein